MSVATSFDTSAKTPRPLKPAVLNGLALKCPRCGEGRLLHGYLKVEDSCACCGLDLSHQRADDGPAYLTILIVGHIMGFALHIAWLLWRPDPLTLSLGLSAVALVSALLMLPRMKGLIVAYQWAKRMHGF